MKLFVGGIASNVTNLGPGKRVVLWVQGCSLNCPGCMSPELFIREQRAARDTTELCNDVLSLSDNHQGLTISGGEPFQQARALYHLVKLIRTNSTLDIMIYSGYRVEEILSKDKDCVRLLSLCDILVDGRFELKSSNKKIWRGSDNQRMLLLSERAEQYQKFADATISTPRHLHVQVSKVGQIRVIGIPERGFIRSFEKKASTKGLFIRKVSNGY